MEEYPVRTVLKCMHGDQFYGTVVVIRGSPIYDEDLNVVGHTKRFLQIRRGNLKGNECREIFDSIDDWQKSLGITYPVANEEPILLSPFNICMASLIVPFSILAAYFHNQAMNSFA